MREGESDSARMGELAHRKSCRTRGRRRRQCADADTRCSCRDPPCTHTGINRHEPQRHHKSDTQTMSHTTISSREKRQAEQRMTRDGVRTHQYMRAFPSLASLKTPYCVWGVCLSSSITAGLRRERERERERDRWDEKLTRRIKNRYRGTNKHHMSIHTPDILSEDRRQRHSMHTQSFPHRPPPVQLQ